MARRKYHRDPRIIEAHGPAIEIEINLGERPTGVELVCCVVCGVEVALDRAAGYDVPVGWLAFEARHAPGKRYLRICRSCLNWATTRMLARDGRRL